MTVTTAQAHIGEAWLPEVIRAEEFALELAPRVNRAWKYPNHGDVFHIPRIGNLTVSTKAASTAWTPQALTDNEQTLLINVHEVVGFQIEDITTLLSQTDLKSEYQKKLGYALGRAVDVNLALVPQGFTQSVGIYGQEIAYDDLLRAWRYIADGGGSMGDNSTLFTSPAAIAGLMKLDIIINQLYNSTSGGRAVETGKIGQVLGAPIIQTNLTRAPAAGQSDSFLIRKEAIALMMAMEPKPITEYIAKETSWVVGMQQVYGFTEVDRYAETPGNTTPAADWAVLIKTIA